jgi:hypothetical protein
MHIILQISQKTVKIKYLFPLCMRPHQLVITLAKNTENFQSSQFKEKLAIVTKKKETAKEIQS